MYVCVVFIGGFGARTRSWQTRSLNRHSHDPCGPRIDASVPARFLGRTEVFQGRVTVGGSFQRLGSCRSRLLPAWKRAVAVAGGSPELLLCGRQRL